MQSTCQYYFAYDFPTKERNQIPLDSGLKKKISCLLVLEKKRKYTLATLVTYSSLHMTNSLIVSCIQYGEYHMLKIFWLPLSKIEICDDLKRPKRKSNSIFEFESEHQHFLNLIIRWKFQFQQMTSPNLCLFCITIMLPMVKLMHLQALLMCLLHIARNVILWLTSSTFYNLDDKYVNSPKKSLDRQFQQKINL